jgi:hypothetical protein
MDDQPTHGRIGVKDTEVLPDQKAQAVPGAAHILQLAARIARRCAVERLITSMSSWRRGKKVESALNHADLCGVSRSKSRIASAAEDLACDA